MAATAFDDKGSRWRSSSSSSLLSSKQQHNHQHKHKHKQQQQQEEQQSFQPQQPLRRRHDNELDNPNDLRQQQQDQAEEHGMHQQQQQEQQQQQQQQRRQKQPSPPQYLNNADHPPRNNKYLYNNSNNNNNSNNPLEGCVELFVGAGWGGVYSFYRRVLDGVQDQGRDARQYCLVEQSNRIGGRTYSVPVSYRHTGGGSDRFVVDVGAYRFTPDMHLIGDLIMKELQLPTVCYEPECPSPQQDLPNDEAASDFLSSTVFPTGPAVRFHYTAPFRRMVDPTTGLPSGFDTALHKMVETCQQLGARVFFETKLVQLKVPNQNDDNNNNNNGEHAKVGVVQNKSETTTTTPLVVGDEEYPTSKDDKATTKAKQPPTKEEEDVDGNEVFELVFQNTETGLYSSLFYRPHSIEANGQSLVLNNGTTTNATTTTATSSSQKKGIKSTEPSTTTTSTSRSSSLQVLFLNLPRNHLLQVQGLRDALDDDVVKTLECMVLDAPEDLFGKQAVQRLQESYHHVTTLGKAYLYYDDAWWVTKLNQTAGEWPPGQGTATTQQGVLLRVRWHDGPVQCESTATTTTTSSATLQERPALQIVDKKDDAAATTTTTTTKHNRTKEEAPPSSSSTTTTSSPPSCRGFLEVYYSVSNETFYSSLPAATDLEQEEHYPQSIQDPLGMVWVTDAPHAQAELNLVHAALMQSLQPLWNQSEALRQASLTVPTPLGMVVGIWQRPNRYHPFGVGWTDPTKVLYEPTMSGTPDKACGGVHGLTEASYRHTVLQPFHVKPSYYLYSSTMSGQTTDTTTALASDEGSNSTMGNSTSTNHNSTNSTDNNSTLSSSSHCSSTRGPTLATVSKLPKIFLVNNDFVCSNVRHAFGDWAEESLLQAERAMYLLGTPKPTWLLNATYYELNVVQPAQPLPPQHGTTNINDTWKTVAVDSVPGMDIGVMAALAIVVTLALAVFLLELCRRRWGTITDSSHGGGSRRGGLIDEQQLLKWNNDPTHLDAGQDLSNGGGGSHKESQIHHRDAPPPQSMGAAITYFGDVDPSDLKRNDALLLTNGTGQEPEKDHHDDKSGGQDGVLLDGDEVDEEEENARAKALDDERMEALNLWRWHNIAIPISYWVGGTSAGMFRTFLNVYPLDIGANEAQQTTCATLAALPAAFKILYGFTSDTNPIFGYRRKPYLFLGWLLASMVMLSLLVSSDLTLVRERIIEDRADGTERKRDVVVVPENAPSLLQLSTCFFLFGFGMWFANAMTDALVAEKAKYEPEAVRGTLQSTCYLMRFFGLMVSAPISTYLYSKVGPKIIVQCLVFIPCLVLPLLYMLAEPRVKVKPVREQCNEIWVTVCSRSVWEPMAFMYLFNLLQISNAAWRQFLVTVLGFTPANLNTLLVVSYVLVYLGTMLYKYCLLHTSWRLIYQGCLVMNLVLSSMQLLLIRGHTFGISPFVFALGDDAFAEFLNGIQFLPAVIMMVSLCPTGSEGVSYATFTTVMNSSWMISNSISSLLLGIWDVSKETMEKGQLDGMFKLSLLTSLVQFSPLFFMSWLPHGRKELEELASRPYSGSAVGGRIFLSVLFGSMAITLIVSLLNILCPGWAGGS
ncbi:hypothetical protein ACA910_017424 [Epithemia clementina (nom. ined.)]